MVGEGYVGRRWGRRKDVSGGVCNLDREEGLLRKNFSK